VSARCHWRGAAFRAPGRYLPTAIRASSPLDGVPVNTWIVLDLVLALVGKLGYPRRDALKIIVGGRR